MKMSLLDTQLEFFNFDLLSDDEVQKIKNVLKQPCSAVVLPDTYLCVLDDQANGMHEYKIAPEMIPVEFTGAVTVGGQYSPHISQAQLYTMTTSVNGTSYISTGYPMTTSVFLPKDYAMPKMMNGLDIGDVSVAAATVASTCDAVLDGMTACIASSPAGGVVVSPNMYAPWSGMYPCTQYMLPHHVPTFFTPIAPVHPSAMRAAGPPVTMRADGYPSQAVAPPYVAVSAMPPVTSAMAVPMTPVPSGLVAGPPQAMIVSSVVTEESAGAILCAEVDETPNMEIVSTAMVTLNPVDMYNGEPEDVQDTDLQGYEAAYGDDAIEVAYEPEEKPEDSNVAEEDVQQNGTEFVPANCEEQEKVELPTVPEANVPMPNSWATNKSWASLFKSSSATSKPSPVAPSSTKVAQLAESSYEQPKVAVEQQPAVNQNKFSNPEPTPSIPETNKPDIVAKAKFPQSNGFRDTNQDELHHLGEVLIDMQLDNRHINFLPRGLSNKGNWCYINSTLQALIACPPFYNLLSKLPIIPGLKHGTSSTPIMDSMVEFVHEFHPASTHKTQVVTLNPRKREDAPSMNIGPQFEPVYIYEMLSRLRLNAFEGRQEDTEEFLSCLLNGLHDEMLAALNNVENKFNNVAANATNGNLEEPLDDEEDETWKVIEKRNKASVTRTTDFQTSPISDIFCGRIRSALHAVSKSSATLQPFFTLQLDIQSEDVRSVKEALLRLVIKESLQGYHCSKTKQEVAASRQITLEELPPILILHLKRFVYDKDGGGQKLSKKIDFSIELDISKELLSPTVKTKLMVKQRSYKLIAVVYHCGGEAAKGHYVADVFHHGSSAWLRTDDSRVFPITEGKVLNHPANMVPYLLFYRRQDTIQCSAINRK